jgi:hypothetical protein
VLAAIVLWGGYEQHWSWTGINGRTATLWDWLNLLLLPAAFAVVPIWLAERHRIGRPHRRIIRAVLGVFVVIVLAGYVIPWHWTGFEGNKLWDWLELVALPLAVALSPMVGPIREAWTPRHTLILTSGLAVFAAIVLAGYTVPWRWTGFRGNTLWDWLHLMFLPLLLPLVVVPRLRPMAHAMLITEPEPLPEPPPTARPPAEPPPAEPLAPKPPPAPDHARKPDPATEG